MGMGTIKHITDKDHDYKAESQYVVILPHVEVRSCYVVDRSFTGKDGKEIDASYLQVTVLDDAHDNFAYLHDKNLGHVDLYKRGTVGTFELSVSVDEGYKGRTKIFIADFKPEEE